MPRNVTFHVNVLKLLLPRQNKITFATERATDTGVRFWDKPGMLINRTAWQFYNSSLIALLKQKIFVY